MATSSTSTTGANSSSAVSTGSIDVASIVSQLMTVEQQPLTALQNKATGIQTVISDLGSMKSLVASLQSALNTFEDPSTYDNPSANSSNTAIATATASSLASVGTSVNVSVTQLAQASNYVLHASGTVGAYVDYASATADTGIMSGTPATVTNPFSIAVNGVTYTTGSAYPIAATGIDSGGHAYASLTDLENWINNLGVNVQANIIQTTDSSHWVLQVSGLQTGAINAVTVTNGAVGAVESKASAQDAIATIGGLTVNRSSNTINDVVTGMSFNLAGVSSGNPPSSTTVTVNQGADNSSAMINTLITAYNAVINKYNDLTANTNNATSSATKAGDLANDPTLVSFVNGIKAMFAQGATDASAATITGLGATTDPSAAKISLDNVKGYLQVGSIKYSFSGVGSSQPTASQFISWANGLGAGITASAVSTANGLTIAIKNSQAGSHTEIDLSGLNNTVSRNTTSLASMGMDLQLDGTIQFNTTEYQNAVGGGLASKLANGLKIGYSGASSNLDSFLTAQVDPTSGVLISEIQAQQQKVTSINNEQSSLQDKLNLIQQNYINQYSALNALLFQLNSTSNALGSQLTALTNSQAKQ